MNFVEHDDNGSYRHIAVKQSCLIKTLRFAYHFPA